MLRKTVFLIATLMLAHTLLWADSTGRIKGVVKDAATGDVLPGANIIIDGTSLGASSDGKGNYKVENVPPGPYTLRIRYIGYQEERKEIRVDPDQTLEINVTLQSVILEGKGITVTAQARGQVAAINQQLSARSIKNIVASDRIKEVPDANAAESIGRLPGVSLARSGGEGNKIIVRGLSPQYTNVEVDGVRMTGVDLDRSVGLSVISSEMLEGIELSKSLTPDKDADAIGGIVNLKLKEAEAGLHFNLLSLGGYNNLETSFNDYKFSGNISNRFYDDKVGILLNLGLERVIRSSDQFSGGYQENIAATNDLYTTSATVSEQKRTRQRSHGSAILDFKTDFMKIKFNNYYSRMKDDNETRDNLFRFSQRNAFGLNISDSHPIESIQSHSLHGTFSLFNTELNCDLSYSETKLDNNVDQYNFDDDYALNVSSIAESRKLFAQPSGLIDDYYDINSGQKSVLIDNVRRTITRRDYTRTYNLYWKIFFNVMQNVSGNLQIGGKYVKKDRRSDTESMQLYYFGGIGIGRVDAIYKTAFPRFKTKQDVGITNAEGLVGANFIDPGYDYGNILNGRYKLGWSADLAYLKFVHDSLYRWKGNDFYWRQGVQSASDDYTNTEELTAGYIMTELNIGERIMLLPGVRFEYMHTQYNGKYIMENPFNPLGILWEEDVTAINENKHWFPSINMKFVINEWSDIRAAAYKSASRPAYNLLSPSLISNSDQTNLTAYNPYLKPALATNFDIDISLFSDKVGLLTVNVFYKEISNLVYRLPRYQPEYFDNLQGVPDALKESLEASRKLYRADLFKKSGTLIANMPVNNPNRAYFRGFEIGLQTHFWYLPGFLSGLVADINFTKIWSETNYPYIGFVPGIDSSGFFPRPINIPVYKTRTGRMIDQPATIVNVRIGWDYHSFSSRLSFRYQGETNAAIDPLHSLLDRKTDALFRVDLQLKQKIMDNLSITVDLANINKSIDDSHLQAQQHVLPTSSEFYGLTSQFGLRYEY